MKVCARVCGLLIEFEDVVVRRCFGCSMHFGVLVVAAVVVVAFVVAFVVTSVVTFSCRRRCRLRQGTTAPDSWREAPST